MLRQIGENDGFYADGEFFVINVDGDLMCILVDSNSELFEDGYDVDLDYLDEGTIDVEARRVFIPWSEIGSCPFCGEEISFRYYEIYYSTEIPFSIYTGECSECIEKLELRIDVLGSDCSIDVFDESERR